MQLQVQEYTRSVADHELRTCTLWSNFRLHVGSMNVITLLDMVTEVKYLAENIERCVYKFNC